MNRRGKALAAVAMLALMLGSGAVAASSAQLMPARAGESRTEPGSVPKACQKSIGTQETTEIAAAKLIVEYNFTDGDLGVHGAFDGDGWKSLCVFDPAGRAVLEVGPRGQLRDLGMGGIFFESREPPSSEFSFADLRREFPEGEYTVRGESFDGTFLTGSATFTHDVPSPPRITSPELAEEPEGTDENPVARRDLVIGWGDVTETVTGEPVDITGYEVIVTKEVEDDPHGFSRPTYDVHVPPSLNSLSVPAEFLEADTVYELEVLALEESGNQTISVGFFKTT